MSARITDPSACREDVEEGDEREANRQVYFSDLVGNDKLVSTALPIQTIPVRAQAISKLMVRKLFELVALSGDKMNFLPALYQLRP